MAGLGNVYKSEVLFACGVHPFRRVGTLTPAEIDCIVDRAQVFLKMNTKDGAGGEMVTYTGLRRTTRACRPGCAALGLSAQRQRVPALRCDDSDAEARAGGAVDVLVSRVPAGDAVNQSGAVGRMVLSVIVSP